MEMTKTKSGNSGNNKEELCPCCKGHHAKQIRTIPETIRFDMKRISYYAQYTYCPYVSEYYQTEEQMRLNQKSMLSARQTGKSAKQIIPQKKITELLLKFHEKARPYDMG